MKSFQQEKRYYSIREVSEIFDVKTSLLRFWEKEFDIIQPKKTDKGTRQYRKEDIDAIRLVYHLVRERGLTLDGAKQRIRDNREGVVNNEEVVNRLKTIRSELIKLRDEFDEMERSMNF